MEVNDQQEILAVLKAYGLGVSQGDNLISHRSFSNRVWQLTNKDCSYILRRYSKLTYEYLLQMNSNLIYLMSLDIPIPQILPCSDGRFAVQISDKAYDLSIFIPHSILRYPDMNITDHQIKQAAELLAKIHSVPLEQLPQPVPYKFIEESNNEHILNLIHLFRKEYPTLISLATQNDKIKLSNLQKLIDLTNDKRGKIINQETFSMTDFPKTLSHGDFSLSNLLPTSAGTKMYIIDWENMGMRTRAWELHRAILLICGKGYCNANFDEPDFQRATIFLDSYVNQSSVSSEEIRALPKLAEYIAYFHWLVFTLESVLKGDNRILDRIPDEIEKGLWWKYNSDMYREWIQSYL